ncbi:hypothetical protein PL9214291339 [Planktothrix tepida PCC 9214]|uniref:Uncharacterized protein n=1 Tax=Planktothrix tepida PCC 9214 TaxID=671072 RepID=A0A1J1LIA0_9CYAN|nr:hypothetical protein PL9214291339 [Planktothrix tepida PCC 9214]
MYIVPGVVVLTWQGLVAQWTRARGYGPRCRGFESLLARLNINHLKR